MQTNKYEVNLYELDELDLEFARTIRNTNRKYFYSPTEVTKEMQQRWYKNLKKNRNEEDIFWIIWINGERAGTVSVEHKIDMLKLGNMIIAKKYRNKGIMRQILWIIEQMYDCSKFELDVMANNKHAIEAYSHLGFKAFGIRMRL